MRGILVDNLLCIRGGDVVILGVGRAAGRDETDVDLAGLALAEFLVDLIEQHVAAALDLALGRVLVVVELDVDVVELRILQGIRDVGVGVRAAHRRGGEDRGVAAGEGAVLADSVLVVLRAGVALDVEIDAVDGVATKDVGIAAAEEVPKLVGEILGVVLVLEAVGLARLRVAPAADRDKHFDAARLAGLDVGAKSVAVARLAVFDRTGTKGGFERFLAAELVHEANVDDVGLRLVTVRFDGGAFSGISTPIEELHAAWVTASLNGCSGSHAGEHGGCEECRFECRVHSF